MEDFPIHLDLDVHKLPCDFIDASFMIRTGKVHNFTRHRLLKTNGTSRSIDPSVFSVARNVTDVVKALDDGEGCKFSGSIYLHMISTKLKIYFNNREMYSRVNKLLKEQNKPQLSMDLSHTINDFRLGNHTVENLAKM